MEPRVKTFFLFVLFMAFIARLFFCFAVVGIHTQPKGDELDYHKIALSIASGEGYSINGAKTAGRPPLFPVFLSFLYKFFGPRTEIARMFEVFLGVILVFLIFKVGSLCFPPHIARLAAILAAMNPFLIFISSYLLTENLYIVLLLLFLLVLNRGLAEKEASMPLAAIAGGVLAMASLTRPPAILLLLFALPALVLHKSSRVGVRMKVISIFLMALMLGIAPWAVRNRAAMGKWVIFTTHGGTTFYQSNNSAVLYNKKYEGSVAPFYEIPSWGELNNMGEVAKDEKAWQMGWEFIKNNKSKLPVLATKKFLRFWRFTSEKGRSGIKSGWWWNKDSFFGHLASSVDIGFIYAIIVIPMFLVGLIITLRSWKRLLLLHAIVLVHTFVAVVYFGSLRGRLPLEPVIAIFASAGIYWVVSKLKLLVEKARSTQSF